MWKNKNVYLYFDHFVQKIDKDNITIISQLFSDDGLKSFTIQKSGDKKFPVKLGISAGKDLLKQSEGKYKKKR